MSPKKNRSFSERLYRVNVMPDGNVHAVEDIDLVIKKLEDPPMDTEETIKE